MATHERGRFGDRRFKSRSRPEQIQVRNDRCMAAVLVAGSLVRKLRNREDTAWPKSEARLDSSRPRLAG